MRPFFDFKLGHNFKDLKGELQEVWKSLESILQPDKIQSLPEQSSSFSSCKLSDIEFIAC